MAWKQHHHSNPIIHFPDIPDTVDSLGNDKDALSKKQMKEQLLRLKVEILSVTNEKSLIINL